MGRVGFDMKRLKEMEALYLFCGGNGQLVADEFGLCRERVRQILNRSTDPEVIKLHLSKLRRNSLVKKCRECERKFDAKTVTYTRSGLCGSCKDFRGRNRTSDRTRPLLVKRYGTCADCNEPFTPENPHRSLMRHRRCYVRYMYHTNPLRRALHCKASIKWHRKKMATDPEYAKKRRAYWAEYYQRPEVKSRMRLAQNRRYHEKKGQVKIAPLTTIP